MFRSRATACVSLHEPTVRPLLGGEGMMIGGRKLIQEQLRYDTTRSEGQGEPYCDALPLKSNMCEPEAPLITLTKTLGSSDGRRAAIGKTYVAQ